MVFMRIEVGDLRLPLVQHRIGSHLLLAQLAATALESYVNTATNLTDSFEMMAVLRQE